MKIRIKNLNIEKFSLKQVISFTALLEKEAVHIKYIATPKFTKIQYMISQEDKFKISKFLNDNYLINGADIFDPELKILVSDNLTALGVPNEKPFVNLFRVSGDKIRDLLSVIIKNRIIGLNNFCKSDIPESSNLFIEEDIVKKHKSDKYSLSLIYSNYQLSYKLDILENKENINHIPLQSFRYSQFKMFLKSHFGIVVSSKKGGIISLLKSGILRSNIQLDIIDSIESVNYIFTKKELEYIESDLNKIFFYIADIFSFLYNKDYILDNNFTINCN